MKNAIIIGASSGMGKELAKILSQNNYRIGLVGRRIELLSLLQQELPTQSFIKSFDISNLNEAMIELEKLIQEMNGVDLVIISAGCGFINSELDFEKREKNSQVNVLGFIAND